uniref:Cation/H+ exchanger transmembrane domain-containing protein n=1 Tax=Pyrodinium bahamense TaxID=73915 RepID=A0A7S0AUC6_9DINO
MALNPLFQIINFVVAWAGSWKIGAIFPKYLMMPMIVGYMMVGFCCSKYVTGMLSPETLSPTNPLSVFSVVTNLTLAFIAFSAGSELHIPSLGNQKLYEICVQIAMTGFFMVIGGMPIIALVGWILPASAHEGSLSCTWAAALLVALVQWAGSVIEVLAIYHETRGRGPVTQLMIGTTMLLDMCVLVFFAVGQNVVISACPEKGVPVSTLGSLLGVLGSLFLWLAFGLALGLLLQLYLKLPQSSAAPERFVKPVLIVCTGGFVYFGLIKLNVWIPAVAPESLSLLRADPLLVCMIGAIWTNHVSSRSDEFRQILHNIAPLVMPPFFTLVGATLDLRTILNNAWAPPALFSLRFAAIALGSLLASVLSDQPTIVRKHLWMTLQSQSGVTIGLVAQMKMGRVGQQPWVPDAAATIIGCVVMNQLVGPTLCRFGIRQAGESHEDEEESSDLREMAGIEVENMLPKDTEQSITNANLSYNAEGMFSKAPPFGPSEKQLGC